MKIEEIWYDGSEKVWQDALRNYWSAVKQENTAVELEMERVNPAAIEAMNTEQFYGWLYDRYFVWKYTAPNRLATTRKKLETYRNDPKAWGDLQRIHRILFKLDLRDIRAGLVEAEKVHGLGMAGASGLLAVLFPGYFGTVDQFAVKELSRMSEHAPHLPKPRANGDMNISLNDAAYIVTVYRAQAGRLNERFQTTDWTPRNIDMVLWSIRSDRDKGGLADAYLDAAGSVSV